MCGFGGCGFDGRLMISICCSSALDNSGLNDYIKDRKGCALWVHPFTTFRRLRYDTDANVS